MDRRFIAMVLVVVAVFGGIYFATKSKDGGTSTNAQPTTHVRGEGSKGVTLVEYGDFECPTCYQFEPVIQEVVKKYSPDITFQFRHYPIDSIHQNARAAHRAAEAAGKQGKFWEMHDKLYEEQRIWSGNQSAAQIFEGYAIEFKLDMDQYKSDVLSSEINDIINADKAEGDKLKVTGTPTFFIDGKMVEELSEVNTVEKLSKLIEDAIAAKTPASPTVSPEATPAPAQ